MVWLVILGMLGVAAFGVWWAVDGHMREAPWDGWGGMRPDQAIPGLPDAIVGRWVRTARPGVGMLVVGLVGLAILALATWIFWRDIAGGDAPELVGGLLAAGALVGVWLLGWARLQFGTPSFISLLRDRPDEIVWVYRTTIERVDRRGRRRGEDRLELTLGLASGRKIALPTFGDAEADVVEAALRRICGSARFGYVEALEARFASAPASLRARS
jgi:hypothetical protein